MQIRVLGSAAGGGFPQWNCNHPNSRRAREGDAAAQQRTQSSIAVSADGKRWFLCNASPDLRAQILHNDVMHPSDGLRHSPIQGVVLTNADVDHTAGLITLRESHPLRVYATQRVLGVLAANKIFNILNPQFVAREMLTMDQPNALICPGGAESGVTVVPFSVPGKIALWLEDASQANFGSVAEDTIAYEFTVDDPGTWDRPWTAEMPMSRTRGPLFEFACHEGNYGLYNTLVGARLEEEQGAAKQGRD